MMTPSTPADDTDADDGRRPAAAAAMIGRAASDRADDDDGGDTQTMPHEQQLLAQRLALLSLSAGGRPTTTTTTTTTTTAGHVSVASVASAPGTGPHMPVHGAIGFPSSSSSSSSTTSSDTSMVPFDPPAILPLSPALTRTHSLSTDDNSTATSASAMPPLPPAATASSSIPHQQQPHYSHTYSTHQQYHQRTVPTPAYDANRVFLARRMQQPYPAQHPTSGSVAAGSGSSAGIVMDDDRSDAATIATSVADLGDVVDVDDDLDDNAQVSGFEAVKRWTVRVNNSSSASAPARLVRGMHVLGAGRNVGWADQSHTAAVQSSSSSSSSSSSASLSLAQLKQRQDMSGNDQRVGATTPKDTDDDVDPESSAEAIPVTGNIRPQSSMIDAQVLASLVATLEDPEDADSLMDFVEGYDPKSTIYHGMDLATAVYERITELQARRQLARRGVVGDELEEGLMADDAIIAGIGIDNSAVGGGGTGGVGTAEWGDWEDVVTANNPDSGINNIFMDSSSVPTVAVAAESMSVRDDDDVDIEDQDDVDDDNGDDEDHNGDWPKQDTDGLGIESSGVADENFDASDSDSWILLAGDDESPSHLNDLTGRPTIRSLPKKALALILIYSRNANLLRACRRLSRAPIPTLGHQLALLALSLTDAASLTEPAVILPRCARAAALNRSSLTLPCLARIISTMSATPFAPTADTLGAVIEIAARGRRWNTVVGALTLAASSSSATTNVATIDRADLEAQHRRRHHVPDDAGHAGGGKSSTTLLVSLVANLVANHGRRLDMVFFREVRDLGIVFADGVRLEAFGVAEDVADWVMEQGGPASIEHAVATVSSGKGLLT